MIVVLQVRKSIGLGPWILADAGLLKGKKATASETDHIKSKGAIVSDESVVRDGNIITGDGPSASKEFAEAVVAALEASGGHTTGDRSQMGTPQTDESSAQTESEAGTAGSGGCHKVEVHGMRLHLRSGTKRGNSL